MSLIALRGIRAQSDATLDLARKVLITTDSENCLLQALETYENRIDSLWTDLESMIELERSRKVNLIEASRDRQKKIRFEIARLERVAGAVRRDEVAHRIDELLEDDEEEKTGCENDLDDSIGRSSVIEEMKATIRRQLDELNSVLKS